MKGRRYLVSALLALLAFSFFSCQEEDADGGIVKEELTPVFPEKVVKDDVQPGEKLKIAFTPNMDWELSVSKESTRHFKLIAPNGRYVETLSGKASDEPVEVGVWVTTLEDDNNFRGCSLSLTMGTESAVIAEYFIPARIKTLEIFAAKVEDGAFVKDVRGEYVYEEVAAEELNVLWSVADAAFILPVKIASNCRWDIDRSTFPKYLDLPVPENTIGTKYLVLEAASLDDVVDEISFMCEEETLKTLSVSVPSCRGIGVYSAQYEEDGWKLLETGDYEYTSVSCDTLSMVWTGSDFRLPVKVDSKCEWQMEGPAWLKEMSWDDRRIGIDEFNFVADPAEYPLDDTSAVVTFLFKDTLIEDVVLKIPGCRNLVSYYMGASVSALEFDYSGRFKTSVDETEAQKTVTGSVTAHKMMTHRKVEILDGSFTETSPSWLKYSIYSTTETDAEVVLQTKAIDVSVTSDNTTKMDRKAFIFLLPSPVAELSDLFEEDGCTVREEYQQYAIPVVQTGLADYLDPTLSPDELAKKDVTFKATDVHDLTGITAEYSYEIEYKNVWAHEQATMSCIYPYESIVYYNAQKEVVSDPDELWVTFSDGETGRKDYGAFVIKGDAEAGTAYAVFKDAEGKALCVVKFTYAEPGDSDNPDAAEVDASEYFVDAEAAAAAGASLVRIYKVDLPEMPDAEDEPKKEDYDDPLLFSADSAQYAAAVHAYDKADSMADQLTICKSVDAPLFKLTYKSETTELKLNFETWLKGYELLFIVNPALIAGDYIHVDRLANSGNLSSGYHGRPTVRMAKVTDDTKREQLKKLPITVFFHDKKDSDRILLGLVCELELSDNAE